MPKVITDVSNRVEQLVSTDGLGNGITNMVQEMPAEYFVKPPLGFAYDLERVNIYILDMGNFRADFYGSSIALENGIHVSVKSGKDNSVLLNLTPYGIRLIGDWHLVAGVDMHYTDFKVGTNQIASVRWTFTKGGSRLILRGGIEYLSFDCRDAMDFLLAHVAQAQGTRRIYEI